MSRLPPGISGPWGGPWAEDAGGAADLQTDVMRFMAILALCLVAIFALVQSVPVAPPAEPASSRTPVEPVAATAPEPEAVPEPVPRVPVAAPPRRTVPATPPEAPRPVSAPAPVAARPAPTADAGFSLRFESDTALKSLVARGEVGLYAMQDGRARRLQLERGRPAFWQASMPASFHEMDADTVPADVAAALVRTDEGSGDGTNNRSGTRTGVQWGVTLPPRLSRDIDGRIARGGGGELVIAANGALRQE